MGYSGSSVPEADAVNGLDTSEGRLSAPQAREVVRRVRAFLVGTGPWNRVAFLCAEVGMGKTWIANQLIGQMRAEGVATRYESLLGLSSDQASRRLVRIVRETVRGEGPASRRSFLVIDDLPPADECDLGRQAGALSRLAERGTFVLVCMRPEAVMLAEEFADSPCMRSSDLASLYADAHAERGPVAARRWRVPALGAALCGAVGAGGHPVASSVEDLLRTLVAGHLRPTLPREEQAVRLSLLLLGSGTPDDLTSTVGRVDLGALRWLGRDAPLLGIDATGERFRCVVVDDDDMLGSCRPALQDACARMPEVTAACARSLATRGSFGRLATVCGLCSDLDWARIGTEWGVDLICSGNAQVVRRALELTERLGVERRSLALLAKEALGLLDAPGALLEDGSPFDRHVATLPRERRQRRLLELLRASRDLDRGRMPSQRLFMRQDEWESASVLVAHVRARHLILLGRFLEAYELLVNEPARLKASSLGGALVCDDFLMAQILTGETPSEDEREANARAQRVFERNRLERLAAYRSMLEPVLVTLAGRSERLEGVERAVARAEHNADAAVQAAFLLAAAVLDNRVSVYARAHVRAIQASELLPRASGAYVKGAARLMSAVAELGSGSDEQLVSLSQEEGASPVRDLAAFMACGGEGEQERIELTALDRASCSRDALWMLNVLGNDCGVRSHLFRQVIPPAWSSLSRRAVRRVEGLTRYAEDGRRSVEGRGGDKAARRDVPAGAPAERPQASRMRVKVSVLGGFSLAVDGRDVSAEGLSRRRARSLVTALAAQRGHAMPRYELVEIIWPECDYKVGMQRLYESTSVVRKLVRGSCGLDPFRVSRGEGTVALDTTVSEFDVDAFERLAHRALATDDDDQVMELACSAREVYRGDLVEVPYDAYGKLDSRRRELRELFVDVSVSGARAAIREDLPTLASRLAESAQRADPLREDSALSLIEALRASGRTVDAREAYRRFATHLLEVTKEPPSASMRSLVRGLFPARQGSSAAVRPDR